MKLLNVETIRNPRDYTRAQVDLALSVAYWLGRGKLVLLLEPDGEHA